MSTISLVLSTYNGARYLQDQLSSLQSQTVQPDEVIIVDDCSTDASPTVVREYLGQWNQASVRFEASTQNLGWKRRFHDLLLEASGDLVFPCDQDDIWLPNKIEQMVELMESRPDIDVLACCVEPFSDGARIQSDYTSSPSLSVNEGRLRRISLDAWSLYVRRPGCTYCVRRSFMREIEGHWRDDWPHDAVLWRFAAAKGTLALLDEPLVRFRRHEGNASRRDIITRDSRVSEIEYYLAMLSEIAEYGRSDNKVSAAVFAFLEVSSDWLLARVRCLESGSFSSLKRLIVLKSLYATRRGLCVDVVLSLKYRLLFR